MTTTKLVFKKSAGLIAWPCVVQVPQEGGLFQEQELTARFRILPQTDIDALYAPGARMTGNPDVELLRKALDGFDGLKDETGAVVPDDVATEWARSVPYVVDGVARGYFGMLGRRLKN